MDWTSVVIAFCAAMGTGFGSWYGIRKSNDLIAYRMDQIEAKVDKHNNLVERVYGIERCVGLLEERFRVSDHRIEDLEDRK